MADEKTNLAPPLSLRLTVDMVARLDRLVEDTQAVSPPGADVTRASILKVAVDTGVEWLKKQAKTLKIIREHNAASNQAAKQEAPPTSETKAPSGETKGGKR